MIIDFHVHYNFHGSRKYTSQEYLAAMDQNHIDKSVMLGIDQMDFGQGPLIPWTQLLKGPTVKKGWLPVPREMPVVVNWTDEEVSEWCKAAPDRFIGFASVHPDHFRPDLKIEWAVKKLGLKGVKLYPHSGFYPNDPRLDRFYEKCVELGIPVMIHTGPKALRMQKLKYNNPINVDDVAVNFPDLDIVFSHGGFPWSDEFLMVAYSNPNIWVDITLLDFPELLYKKVGYTEYMMRTLIDLVGPERLLWGSEGPFMTLPMFGEFGPDEQIRSMNSLVKRFDFLNDKDKENILGGNAARLLKFSS